MDRSPITMRSFVKTFVFFIWVGHLWQFNHFNFFFWNLPIGRLHGTTIPLQKKSFSFSQRSFFSLQILPLFFCIVRFLALVMGSRHDVVGDDRGFYRASWWGVVSVLEMVFEFNHKIMINVQKSPPSIMVTRKPMVCERLDKGLVVQGEDVSPPVHTT
jgi:hypothetical protein